VRTRYTAKDVQLTLMEVDPSGKSAVDVAVLTLDLAQLVDTEPSTKTAAMNLLPGAPSACPCERAQHVEWDSLALTFD